MKTETPTLDKMLENKEASQTIGEFLDWLSQSKDFKICAVHRHNENCYGEGGKAWGTECGHISGEWYPVYENIENVLAEYFGIDLKEAEKEKREILKNLRKNNS